MAVSERSVCYCYTTYHLNNDRWPTCFLCFAVSKLNLPWVDLVLAWIRSVLPWVNFVLPWINGVLSWVNFVLPLDSIVLPWVKFVALWLCVLPWQLWATVKMRQVFQLAMALNRVKNDYDTKHITLLQPLCSPTSFQSPWKLCKKTTDAFS